jgi:ATP-dependent Clp protease adaptor protein ClpS
MTETGSVTITDTGTSLGEGYKVILYDDDTHTMDEVVAQVMRAIGCSKERAEEIMFEAHSKGRAMVIAAHLERCEHVAAVLERIGLHTDIE